MLERGGNRGVLGHRLRCRLFGAGEDAARPRYPGRLRPAQIRERAGAPREPCPGAASGGVNPALSRRRIARVLMWLVGVPLIAYLIVLGYLYVFQRQLMYFPDRARPQLGLLRELGLREVSLTTTDGLALLSWYLPPREGRPVILYFHGNGGNIGHRAERIERFGHEGYGVLMVEYRGYGGNPGAPTETGLFDDARTALDFLQREGIAARRLVL